MTFIAPLDQYSQRLIDAGFMFQHFEMDRRSLNPFGELFTIYRLRKQLASIQADILFSFTIKCVVYGGIALKGLGYRGHIGAIAGLGSIFSSNSSKIRLLQPLVGMAFRMALSGSGTRVILQNTVDFALFQQRSYVADSKVYLIKGSGVDGVKFHPSRRYKSTILKVLFASRLLRSKGIEYFVEAGGELSKKAQVEFLVAGDLDPGNPESITETQLRTWAELGSINMLGHVEDMQKLIEKVDLVVLPSTYGEGVPRILIEAAASGKPIVAFANNGTSEIVKDGENGYLTPAGDQVSLNQAISKLLESEDLRDSFGRNSRLKFESEFAQEKVLGETIRLVHSVLS